MTTEIKNVSRWFVEVGNGSNEPLSLHFADNGTASIINEDGVVASMCSDWDRFLTAPTFAELDALCGEDLAALA